MSEFDFFDEIEQQLSRGVNTGSKVRRSGRGRFASLSPNVLRAKVARPPVAAPAAAVEAPVAIREPDPEPPLLRPVKGRTLYTRSDLIAALRERKEELNLSHETIDTLAGWADRMSSKVLAPVPRRGMSGDTLQIVLDVLGLRLAAVVLVEDPEQSDKMRHRWKARGPSGPRPSGCALFSEGAPANASSTTEHEHVEASPEFPTEA